MWVVDWVHARDSGDLRDVKVVVSWLRWTRVFDGREMHNQLVPHHVD
jgi:hypothetical protein